MLDRKNKTETLMRKQTSHELYKLLIQLYRVATVSEKSGKKKKKKIFQGQGKTSEFCIWSGKFGIPLKVREKSGKF